MVTQYDQVSRPGLVLCSVVFSLYERMRNRCFQYDRAKEKNQSEQNKAELPSLTLSSPILSCIFYYGETDILAESIGVLPGITWYCCIHHLANHAHSAMTGIYGNSSPIGNLLVVKYN